MRMSKTVKLLALSTAVGLGAGCFGKFAASHALYKFNQDISRNKVVRTLVMWGLIIVPVYELFFVGDFLIFNTIEFWTGDNVIADRSTSGAASSVAELRTHEDEHGLHLVRGDVEYLLAPVTDNAFSVLRNGALVGAGELEGETLSLYDERGALIACFNKDELALAHAAVAGPRAAID